MISLCRILFKNLNANSPKLMRLQVPSVEFFRHFSQDEQQNTSKQGAFAEFYEKTKENKKTVEEDGDFEVLLRNSNFINVICKRF